MVKFSERGVKREEERAGLGRSPGEEGNTKQSRKKNPGLAWGGLRPQSQQAMLGWDTGRFRGWAQLPHPRCSVILEGSSHTPSSLSSAFPGCPQENFPVISIIPPTSQGPMLPRDGRLAPVQGREGRGTPSLSLNSG